MLRLFFCLPCLVEKIISISFLVVLVLAFGAKLSMSFLSYKLPKSVPFRRALHPTLFRLGSLVPLNSQFSSSSSDISPPEKKPRDTSKLCFAFVMSYVGTNYFGSQFVPNTPERPTVESHLMEALFKVGLISPSNYLLVNKLYWRRSSRTDKGVHACRMLVSSHVDVKRTLLDMPSEEISQFLCNSINSHLPSDIQVNSCHRVTFNFNSRRKVNWREYEYLLPVEFLSESSGNMSPSDVDNILEKLNNITSLFEGSNSFHNFHNVREKEFARRPMKNMNVSSSNNSNGEEVLNDSQNNIDMVEKLRNDDNDLEVDEVDNEPFDDMQDDFSPPVVEKLDYQISRDNMYRDLQDIYNRNVGPESLENKYLRFVPRTVNQQTYRLLYDFHADRVVTGSDGRKYVKMVIRGGSFLYK